VVLIVDKQKLVAGPRVGQAAATRVSWRAVIRDLAHGTASGQVLVGEIKQRGKWFGGQAKDSEAHVLLRRLCRRT
jgi:hypothetical protein